MNQRRTCRLCVLSKSVHNRPILQNVVDAQLETEYSFLKNHQHYPVVLLTLNLHQNPVGPHQVGGSLLRETGERLL